MALAPLLFVAALLALPAGGYAVGDSKNLHPVVLVPGYGSNQLEAQLTAAYEPSATPCAVADPLEWFPLWPNHTGMHDAAQVPCFADQMSLVYDAGADDYRNADGVATRVPFFGSTRSLVGWDLLVRRLEGVMGYRDGASLFAAPYDFRYAVAPRGHPSAVGARYFRDLGCLIRRASRLNQGRPAILVAHSFGCALTYQFLLSRPFPWRRRFVKHVVLLAPALGGFAGGMYGLSSGIGYGLPNVTRATMTRLARSQQSTLWRLPTPTVFGDRPLVVTKGGATYTALDVAEFLDAIGFPEGVRPYVTRVLPMWQALPAPMVPVTSVIGVGVRTPETYVFATDGFEGEPEVVYGDGDGDINMVSLVAIEEWSGVQGQVLNVVRLPGVHHSGFFSGDFALTTVLAEIYAAGRSAELHHDDMAIKWRCVVRLPLHRGAASYDFRYTVAPHSHPSAVGDCYFRDLGRLIRRASRLNQGRPAIVVAHSFGCALTYQFLLARPLPWRRRFVKHVVLLAPALGGFASGMYGLSSGIGYGLLNGMTRLARSQQSTLWRLPTPTVFGDRPLVVTKGGATYTARDVAEFLEAIGFPEGVRPYVTRVLPMWQALPAPMVPVTSVIGVGVRTPETYVFGAEGFDGEPEVVYGDGDGDINMVSLVAIEEWSGVQGQVLNVVRLPGVHHSGFFSGDFALTTVLAEIYAAGRSAELHHDDM
ncbi:hypothetical protein EJB05_07465 [Eragrostis curvula]|uniref:AB hydrolase-1 domain-containing protein n=1 Tax=Eragrostis curvula TaxID=38414 RepID=A0A5J9WIG6_9POAL|nr:hypothetical protein EJB05_07465 [Eragrostis curvula]